MPLSEWSEKQFLMLTAGIVGGVLVIGAGVLFYVYSTYTGLEAEIEATDKKVRGLEKEADRNEEVRKELEEVIGRNLELLERVPREEKLDQFMQQINEQSRNAHLSVVGMQPIDDKSRGRRRTKPPTYQPLRMKVDCAGGYHDLGRFINRVEQRMTRLVTVYSFSVSAFKDGLFPGSRALEIELELETYKYNEKNPSKKAR